MAKRRRKRKQRSKIRLILLLAVILIIAGFVTRRVLVPGAIDHLRHFTSSKYSHSSENQAGEHLTNQDRQALDNAIRSRSH